MKGNCYSRYTIEELFVNPSNWQSNKLRRRLLIDKIKDFVCEICGLTEWMGNPIPLELDHIDGDKHNNELDNLRIICPNCHATTSTYRGKNIGRYG